MRAQVQVWMRDKAEEMRRMADLALSRWTSGCCLVLRVDMGVQRGFFPTAVVVVVSWRAEGEARERMDIVLQDAGKVQSIRPKTS